MGKAVAYMPDSGKPSGVVARSRIDRRVLLGLFLASILCSGLTDCEERARDERRKQEEEEEKLERKKRTGPMKLKERMGSSGNY